LLRGPLRSNGRVRGRFGKEDEGCVPDAGIPSPSHRFAVGPSLSRKREREYSYLLASTIRAMADFGMA
jgi:hypothetical protein